MTPARSSRDRPCCPAPDRQQDVRAHLHGLPGRAVDADRHAILVASNAMQVASVRTTIPSSVRISRMASDTSSSSRAISRGAISMTVTSAETPVHVRELEADIASADDDQVPRDGIEL